MISKLRRKCLNLPPSPLALPIFDNWLQIVNDLNHHHFTDYIKKFGHSLLLSLLTAQVPKLGGSLSFTVWIQKLSSNPFQNGLSPLHTPLLASTPNSPISEDVSILCLNENYEDDELGNQGSPLVKLVADANRFGIVLVHGFGGGVFSWRKIMRALARQTGYAVVAFDRPEWGLTSRPRQKDWEKNQLSNPYKIDNQTHCKKRKEKKGRRTQFCEP